MSLVASKSAVVHGFQVFYYELLRQKEKALSLYITHDIQAAVEGIEEKENNEEQEDTPLVINRQSEVEGAIVTMQKRLSRVIDDVSHVILTSSGMLPKYAEDAKYIITILADEVFINLNWEGAKIWKKYLLEKRFFQSELAGDKFFEMADTVLSETNNEEISFVYLMALSLGFKGKYRDVENAEERVNWYKSKFYAILQTKNQRLFYPGRPCLIDSCYEPTIMDHSSSVMPDTNYWTLCIVSVLVIYIVISYLVWFMITKDINAILNEISNYTRTDFASTALGRAG